MTAEQLVLLAQEFGSRFPVTIKNYAALVAAAAASTAKIEGIAVHGTHRQAAAALESVLLNVPALDGYNKEFARFCAHIYMETCYSR